MPVLPRITVLACVIVPAVTLKLPSALVVPTVLLNVTVPPVPAVRVSAGFSVTPSPAKVLLKKIFAPAVVPPLFVVSKVSGVAFKIVGPVMVMIPPLVVILPFTLIAVDPV